MPAPASDRIIWIDLETTGLRPETDQILEVAVIVTDDSFAKLASATSVVRPDGDLDELLGSMDERVQDMHRKSGLEEALRDDGRPITVIDGEVAEMIRVVAGSGPFLLGGNSVAFDRAFIDRYMPETAALLHYRNFDVRVIQTLFDMAGVGADYQGILDGFEKGMTAHRALSDIRLSVERTAVAVEFISSPDSDAR